MNRQEEIREAIDTYVDDVCLYPDKDCNFRSKDFQGYYCTSGGGAYKCLMERLKKIGVVIKVDRELPPDWLEFSDWVKREVEASFEPLIKEEIEGINPQAIEHTTHGLYPPKQDLGA